MLLSEKGIIIATVAVSRKKALGGVYVVRQVILEKLTGQRGAFATSIAYVLEQDRGGSRHYALLVSDVDGANRREVFSSNQPILSPAWSLDGR